MTERFNNLTIQLLGDDTSPVDSALVSKSSFLQSAISFNLGRIVAQAAEGIGKDPSLGTLWSAVPPKDGAFEFELATVLPYYLPTLAGRPEYAVTIRHSELIVCSRMLRCFYSRPDATVDPLEYFLSHRLVLPAFVEKERLIHLHPVPLRTFVAKRFTCIGRNAERIIQENFLGWADQLLSEIALLVDSVRVASPADIKHLFPHLARPSFPLFWIVIKGDDALGSAQFCGDLPQHAFRPVHNLEPPAVATLTAHLSGDQHVAVHRSALSLARTYVHYGNLDLAILHLCMSCESALGQAYKAFLLGRGVSKTKYDEAETDIGFSALLNLHLYSMCDVTKLPQHQDRIGQLNWARKARNDIMHRGTAAESLIRTDVEQAIHSADSLITFLSDTGALGET